jgi:hypothetical protein
MQKVINRKEKPPFCFLKNQNKCHFVKYSTPNNAFLFTSCPFIPYFLGQSVSFAIQVSEESQKNPIKFGVSLNLHYLCRQILII